MKNNSEKRMQDMSQNKSFLQFNIKDITHIILKPAGGKSLSVADRLKQILPQNLSAKSKEDFKKEIQDYMTESKDGKK